MDSLAHPTWQASSAGAQGSPLPLYQQIKRYILEHIESGRWRPGDRVPSEAKMVRTLGISRMTVNRALRELTDQGRLVRLQGVGTFVAQAKPEFALLEIKNISQEIAERGGRYRGKVLELARVSAGPELAAAMELPLGSPVFHSLMVHFDDRRPVQVEDRQVNPALVPGYLDQDFTAQTPNQYLVQVVPLSQVEVEHVIEAVRPDKETQELLQVPLDEPCLVLHRRTWAQGQVVTRCRLTHPGSGYRISGRFRP